ncbi:hypothetical protein BDW69DRAFT_185994 [Aspergillus filifer]
MEVSTPLNTPLASSSYTLTALDHLIFPLYLGGILTFDLKGKDRKAILERLKIATDRLCAHLPVLPGCVVPAPDTEGRTNAFEVRSDIKDTNPFLQVKEQLPFNPLLIDGCLNPEFLPEPILFDPSGPCPVMRAKANLQGDFLHLVTGSHHMVMDGMGSTVVGQALAQLCRDPDTPASALCTTAAAQQGMREHLTKLGLSSTPEKLKWDTKPYDFPLLGSEDPKHHTLNLRYPIRKDKLALLQDACRHILRDSSVDQGRDTSFSTSLIVGSLVSICVHRARHAAGLGHLYESTLGFACNLREKLGLPSSYMGNAVVAVDARLDRETVSPLTSTHDTSLLSGMSSIDLYQLTNVALSVSEALDEYTPSHVAGMLSTLGALGDHSSVRGSFRGLAFSDLHKMNFYT